MEGSEDYDERLATAARGFRNAGALGRSDVLVRLFDFLLECSLVGRAPKEVEIAHEVFGKGAPYDTVEDASVRVYIHRLRRKLDEFYGSADGSAERLTVPRGEYRLVLAPPASAPMRAESRSDSDAPAAPAATASDFRRVDRRTWLGMGLLAAANLAGWGLWGRRRPADPFRAVEHTNFWRPLAIGERPVLVAAGDYFIFGDAPDSKQVRRLVREFGINSREDLDSYLMGNPDLMGRYVDLDLHYLPVGNFQAFQLLLPIASGAARRGKFPLQVTLMSRLTPDQPKNSDLLYIGLLSGLGLLREPLFGVSSFRIGDSYDEIIDRRTNVRYASDWPQGANGDQSRRDFSYLASWAGPAGDRIMIVAGTRDAGLVQAARIAADPTQLARIAEKTGGAEDFEALYEVRTLGNLDLNSSLVVARPMRNAGARRRGDRMQQFPDQQLPSAEPPKS